jgi:(R,R)-butanediol dehydrogenase / meso-butanediol dehydrogenase / diacetyl reductase
MRAITLHGHRDLRIDETAEPSAPEPGFVALRNLRAGICGTDLHEYMDGPSLTTVGPHPLTGAALSQILGHEYSGEVTAVGAGVASVRPGDRVAVMPLFFCGACRPCRTGSPQTCEILGAVGYNWRWGGMAERSIVAEHQVAVLPDEMTDEQGALVEPAAVALHSVTTAGVAPGDKVLVTGGGPIGQLVALAAAAAGATEVYLSEANPRRLARAAALGLTAVLDARERHVADELRERIGGGVDVAVECAGGSAPLATCVEAVRNGGTVMQTALHTTPASLDMRTVTLRDLTLRGANCFPVDSWPRVIELIASGRLPAERIVTATVPIDDAIDRGFDALLDPDGDQIKILLEL